MTLGLKVVDTTEVKGEVQLQGPAILELGSGTVAPFFGGGVKATNTVETTMNFRLRLLHEPQFESSCDTTPAEARDGYAFEAWLSSVIASLEPNSRFRPAGELDSIQFKGTFGVVKSASGGAQLKLVFLSGKPEILASRDDVQSVDFTIRAPDKDAPMPKGNPGDGGPVIMME